MGGTEWAIIYRRPDGWWCAGDGFETDAAAVAAAHEHDWRGSEWNVVISAEMSDILCPEGLEAFEGDD